MVRNNEFSVLDRSVELLLAAVGLTSIGRILFQLLLCVRIGSLELKTFASLAVNISWKVVIFRNQFEATNLEIASALEGFSSQSARIRLCQWKVNMKENICLRHFVMNVYVQESLQKCVKREIIIFILHKILLA